jgi:hypothetical protein
MEPMVEYRRADDGSLLRRRSCAHLQCSIHSFSGSQPSRSVQDCHCRYTTKEQPWPHRDVEGLLLLIRKCHVAYDPIPGIDSLVQLQRLATPQDTHSADLSRADEGGERV